MKRLGLLLSIAFVSALMTGCCCSKGYGAFRPSPCGPCSAGAYAAPQPAFAASPQFAPAPAPAPGGCPTCGPGF